MKPRRKYDPNRLLRQMSASQDKKPLIPSQASDLGLAHRLSFDAIIRGHATEEMWSNVAVSLDMALVLAEKGWGEQHIPVIQDALLGMMRAKKRGDAAGQWGLDGEAIKAIRESLTLHDEQMEVASRADVRWAIKEVRKRVDSGNVLEVA